MKRNRLLLAGQVVAQVEGNQVGYFHHDALGSVIAESSSSGSLQYQHYRPFGEQIDAITSTNKQAYTGHIQDDTGLVYMQQRYYDPLIGRFYSNNPVDFLGHMRRGNPTMGFNRYAYANNNPYKYVDPDGRAAIAVCAVPPVSAGCAAVAQKAVEIAVIGGLLVYNAYNALNESSDKLGEVLEGASKGEKTKGRTTNWDKPGGMNEADSDFDNLVDPDSIVPITDSKGGDGRRGTMNDGSGRSINVRPNSNDGRPSIEIQDGKNKIKIRYGEKEEK